MSIDLFITYIKHLNFGKFSIIIILLQYYFNHYYILSGLEKNIFLANSKNNRIDTHTHTKTSKNTTLKNHPKMKILLLKTPFFI